MKCASPIISRCFLVLSEWSDKDARAIPGERDTGKLDRDKLVIVAVFPHPSAAYRSEVSTVFLLPRSHDVIRPVLRYRLLTRLRHGHSPSQFSRLRMIAVGHPRGGIDFLTSLSRSKATWGNLAGVRQQSEMRWWGSCRRALTPRCFSRQGMCTTWMCLSTFQGCASPKALLPHHHTSSSWMIPWSAASSLKGGCNGGLR